MLFAGVMALVAFVLSLGSKLLVDGHSTISLPFAWLAQVPILQGLLSNRLSLFTALFVSTMFAIGIDELRSRISNASTLAWSPRLKSTMVVGVAGALSVAVLIPLWPDHAPSTTATTSTNVPPFFTSAAIHRIPTGSVVLAYPYPDQQTTNFIDFHPGQSVLLDQAIAGFRFKIIGGYGWFPSPTGSNGTINPSILQPRSVQALFDAAYLGSTLTQRGLASGTGLASQMRSFLTKFDVQTVIVLHQGKNPALAAQSVTAAIGPPIESGGVTIWFNVGKRLALTKHP